jgi:general secretion pathway protein G
MRFISSITRAALGVLIAVAVLVGVVGGCYWLSLVASLRGLEAGIRERDVVKLEKYIDWPRVREQIRSELQAFVMTQVFKDAKKGEEGGLASSIGTLLAGTVAPAMIDRVVDGLVTPQSLVRLLAEKPPSEQPGLSFAREGFTDFDEYTLLPGTSAPAHPRIRAILRRDGITWRVVRIVFPPGESPWETVGTGLQLGSAKEKIAHQSIERLAGVLDIYKQAVGTYPTTEQGLLALVERPSGVTHWNGPYLKGDKVPEDPWGRPFVYHNPSQRPGHEYDLYSLGPTGQPGGTGDAATIFND